MKHCLFAVFAFLASVAVSAATLVVDQSGKEPGAFRTINEAAEKAGAGDTVLVYPGVYREHVAPVRGGIIDLRRMFRDLAARKDNPLDDGRVEGHVSLADRETETERER